MKAIWCLGYFRSPFSRKKVSSTWTKPRECLKSLSIRKWMPYLLSARREDFRVTEMSVLWDVSRNRFYYNCATTTKVHLWIMVLIAVNFLYHFICDVIIKYPTLIRLSVQYIFSIETWCWRQLFIHNELDHAKFFSRFLPVLLFNCLEVGILSWPSSRRSMCSSQIDCIYFGKVHPFIDKASL